MRWVVVRTQPNREQWAAKNVRAQGCPYVLPTYIDEKSRKPKVLFPSYLFVGIGERWTFLTGTYGVAQVLTRGSQPLTVPPRIMDEIRKRAKHGPIKLPPPDEIKVGTRVKMLSGPLEGQIGLYGGMTVHERCKVLFQWLTADVSRSEIEPIEELDD